MNRQAHSASESHSQESVTSSSQESEELDDNLQKVLKGVCWKQEKQAFKSARKKGNGLTATDIPSF